ncbi:hemerythrin domain-containing protein [Flammeovirga agarivorans]|uniref:Hemerythrin-like domain-containing protein n=1 Tax=Flammeovirga agarivorans TaxID=2726742 RepID=A0A7X8SGV7_9BACT|nr:hemerythrin domain-containing protein [Flammeovirga agarivorans]NLR89877.1 hypothetical protein [Flammeovirga agarivorans]
MKRNENLIPLSHEHHHGLVFCHRLKKLNHTDQLTAVRYINDYYENHLRNHFTEEENTLAYLINDEKIKRRFLNDHNIISNIITNINITPSDVIEQGLALSQIINNHIRFEERILFPWLEENLSDKELFGIGNDLNVEVTEIEGHAFEPEFWEN